MALTANINPDYPNRVEIHLDFLTGPFTVGAGAALDPRQCFELYVGGVPVPIISFSFDVPTNRYLLFTQQLIDMTQVVQVVYHIPATSFGSGGSTLPGFALVATMTTGFDGETGGGGPTVTPPIAPGTGQSLAWAYAQNSKATSSGTGQSSSSGTTGTISVTGTHGGVTVADRGAAQITWSNWALGTSLPLGAQIASILPVIQITGFNVTQSQFFPPWNNAAAVGIFENTTPLYAGPTVGALAALANFTIGVGLEYSLDGAIFADQVIVGFVALAVYYTT